MAPTWSLVRHLARYPFDRIVGGSAYSLDSVGAALAAMRSQRELEPAIVPHGVDRS